MSIAKTLLGNARIVAETGETGWGDETTQILVDLIDIANISVQELASGSLVRVLPPTSASLAASGTLTPTSSYMRIDSTGGAVVIDTTTPIVAGEFDGQELELEGTSDTNTVEIRDSGTVDLNGLIVLNNGQWITLRWNDTLSKWRERNRNR